VLTELALAQELQLLLVALALEEELSQGQQLGLGQELKPRAQGASASSDQASDSVSSRTLSSTRAEAPHGHP